MTKSRLRVFALISLGLFGCAVGSRAQTANWTGANSNDWFDAGNWSPSGVPSGDLYFSNTPEAVVSSSSTGANSLNLEGTASVTVTNGELLQYGGGGLHVGYDQFHTGGLLTVSGGAILYNAFPGNPVAEILGGSVLVTGAGSSWNSISSQAIEVGAIGNGTLTVADGGSVTSNSGFILGGPLAFNSSITIGTGTTTAGTLYGDINGASGGVNVVFNHTSTDYTFSNNLSGYLGVHHSAGTTTITGNNTYSGGTIIQGGTLILNSATNNALGTGSVYAGNNGTLGGTGHVAGDVTIDVSGHLAPGAAGMSSAVLDFGAGLTMLGGANFDIELGRDHTVTVSGGAFDATNGVVTFNFGASELLAASQTYTLLSIIDAGTAATDYSDLSHFAVGTVGLGVASDYTLFWDGSALTVTTAGTFTAVPEPGTYALFAGLGALGLTAWRRRHAA